RGRPSAERLDDRVRALAGSSRGADLPGQPEHSGIPGDLHRAGRSLTYSLLPAPRMRFRRILLLPLAAASLLRAQEVFYRPVPFGPAPPASSPGENSLARIAADRAQELGFPAIAAS